MECNKDEAARAKEIAEKKFAERDLQGAKKLALKAQTLFPGLECIDQMVATMDIYLKSEVKVNGEKDWYSILSVDTTADDETLKKEYRKLILRLHPDKNKSVGAEGAFQMVRDVYAVLSDKTERALYDQKRKIIRVPQQRTSQSSKPSAAPSAANSFSNFPTNSAAASKVKARPTTGRSTHAVRQRTSQPPPPSPPPPQPAPAPAPTPAPAHCPDSPPSTPTFWTSCKTCKMHYEYLRVYLNHHIRCPSCLEPFLAKEMWGLFPRAAGASGASASSAAAQSPNVVYQTSEKDRKERDEEQVAAIREEPIRRNHNPLKRQINMTENVGIGFVSSKKVRTLGKDVGIVFSSIASGHGSNSFIGSGGQGEMSGGEAPNVPKYSYELDPAAISNELLQDITEAATETNGTSEC